MFPINIITACFRNMLYSVQAGSDALTSLFFKYPLVDTANYHQEKSTYYYQFEEPCITKHPLSVTIAGEKLTIKVGPKTVFDASNFKINGYLNDLQGVPTKMSFLKICTVWLAVK